MCPVNVLALNLLVPTKRKLEDFLSKVAQQRSICRLSDIHFSLLLALQRTFKQSEKYELQCNCEVINDHFIAMRIAKISV